MGALEALTPLFEVFTNPASRTHWMGLAIFVFGAVLWKGLSPTLRYIRYCLQHRSVHLDIQLLVFNRVIRLLWVALAASLTWKLAVETTGVLRNCFGETTGTMSQLSMMMLYSAVLFVLDDASRFLVHRAFHKIPFLWNFHQVHHSATELTPLTFFRIHPVESLVYQARAVIVMGMSAGLFYWLGGPAITPFQLLGVPALAFVLNTVFGNFRHSNLFLRFPESVEKWFISPAQHQLHHSIEEQHWNRNFGTWLSIWDRLSGTLLVSSSKPTRFGLQEPNHEHALLDALFKPLASKKMAVFVTLGLLFLSQNAMAEEDTPSDTTNDTAQSSDEDTESQPTSSGQIIVYGEDEHIKEAGSAHQVSSETLEKFEWNDIQQVMTMIPGVSTRTEDGFGLRPNIGIRGANSDRSAKVTLMEDGVLFAPAPYAAPAAYFFPMTTRLVGVEVFKGAASTRYGPQTVGGAVNLLTRDVPDENIWSGDVSYGAFNTLKGHVYAGGVVGKWKALIEGTHLQSDGFKQLASGADTGFSRTDSMLKLKRSLDSHAIQLKLGYARERSYETYLGLSSSDFEKNPLLRYPASQEGLMEWTRTQSEILWTARPSDLVLVKTVAYHHFLDRSWRKFNGFANGLDVHNLLLQDPTGGEGAMYLAFLRGDSDALLPEEYLQIGINARQFHSFGLQTTSIIEAIGDVQSHRIEVGARIHGDLVYRQHTERSAQMIDQELLYVDESQRELLNTQVGAIAVALYAHDDWTFEKLHLFPSLRSEIVQTTTEIDGWTDPITRAVLLPGMGSMWEFDDWLDIFVSAHKGFSPVAPEQDADVLPEVAWNYEAGLRQYLDTTRAEVILFVNDYQRITGQCTLSSGCNPNDLGKQFTGGKALIVGAETMFGLETWLPNGWIVPTKMQYTFTHAEFRENFYSGFSQFGSVNAGDRLPYVAMHQGSLSSGIQTDKISLNVITAYRGQMLDQAGDLENTTTIPSLWTVDASGHVLLQDNWKLYATWNNVTNVQAMTSWRPFGARPIAPSSVYFGVKRDL